MTSPSRLQQVERSHPEWGPWLAVVTRIGAELDEPHWTRPPLEREAGARDAEPADARLQSQQASLPDPSDIARLLASLLVTAGGRSPVPREGRDATACSEALAMAAFRAALNMDDAALARLAESIDADRGLFRAVALLLPVPWLHASRREFARPAAWRHGFCPCCGAWPTLAQVCGIERARYLSCGRCGTSWQVSTLWCPYCNSSDHEVLRALQVEPDLVGSAIDVCNGCRGYVKSIRKLSLCPPEEVLLEDLASVELDIIAAQRDYRRPPGVGCLLAG